MDVIQVTKGAIYARSRVGGHTAPRDISGPIGELTKHEPPMSTLNDRERALEYGGCCYGPKLALGPQVVSLKPSVVSFFALRFTVFVMFH